MSRKSPNETPPPGGSNLLNDFQTFCQSPAFTAALQTSPLAAQLLQQMALSPTSVSSIPNSDYHTNIQCLSHHLSKPFNETILMFPDTQSTWELFQLSPKLVKGYFNSLYSSFHIMGSCPSCACSSFQLSSSQLAAQLFQNFRDSYRFLPLGHIIR